MHPFLKIALQLPAILADTAVLAGQIVRWSTIVVPVKPACVNLSYPSRDAYPDVLSDYCSLARLIMLLGPVSPLL